jgi:hypothetical protein
MKRLHQTWLLFALAMVLSACAQLGLQSPQTLEDRIQYGKAGVTAAYRQLGDAVATKQVTATRAADYFGRIEKVEQGVNTADALRTQGKPVDALSTLNLALAALVVIRNELPRNP